MTDLEIKRVVKENHLSTIEEVTDYVKANGMGGVDSARFAEAMKQLSQNFKLSSAPDVSKIFTDAYLPEAGERMLK